jgi:hypothetical protein
LGTWRGPSENTLGIRKKWKKSFPSQNIKWKKTKCMFWPSHWLHEISLPKRQWMKVFGPSYKVCDYTFNFMAMSCLLWLIVLLHLSIPTRLFLVACVHYDYKWITNVLLVEGWLWLNTYTYKKKHVNKYLWKQEYRSS